MKIGIGIGIGYPEPWLLQGGGGGEDPDAAAYLDAAGITDPTQRSAWNSFVLTGKATGWYSGLLYCWPMIGNTFNQHKINAITPASNILVKTGTVTSAVTGMTSDGTTGYLNTGIDLSSLVATNAHFSIYSRGVAADGEEWRVFDVSFVYSLRFCTPRADTTTDMCIYLDGNTDPGSTVPETAGGLFTMTRSGTAAKFYRNATEIDAKTQTGTAAQLPFLLYLFANNFNAGISVTGCTKEVAFLSVGTNRTAGQEASFSAAMTNLQTSLGRNV